MGNTPQPSHGRRGPNGPRRAFTIIEILIVVAVVILLLSILIVAVNKSVQAAQATNTRFLMTTIKTGMIQFKEDVGYYPPVLQPNRDLWHPPHPTAPDYIDLVQKWFSITTPADYLIGYGDEKDDGHGREGDATRPALGIRSPGYDGVWGATLNGNAGEFDNRNGPAAGEVYGPYIDLSDEDALAAVDPMGNIVFAGEDPLFDTYPKVIVDHWGEPIRYFRRPYPPGALSQSWRAVDQDGDGEVDRVPSLSDIFMLRPYDIEVGKAIDNPIADFSTFADTSTTHELNVAEFALFSTGPNREANHAMRVDPDEVNRDNIQEFGP